MKLKRKHAEKYLRKHGGAVNYTIPLGGDGPTMVEVYVTGIGAGKGKNLVAAVKDARKKHKASRKAEKKAEKSSNGAPRTEKAQGNPN